MTKPASYLPRNEIDAWLALSNTRGVPASVWAQLACEQGLSALDIVHQRISLPTNPQSSAKLIRALSSLDGQLVEHCRQWLAGSADHHIISLGCANYPFALKQIPSPPLVLFVKGNAELLCRPQIAIVGSRRASASALQNAFEFGHTLAAAGLTVVSGLAIGIDGAAHTGACGQPGNTIAVLGSGVDQVYPRRHRKLYQQILAQGGAIVSEFWPGSAAKAQHFPRRNRIIAGLSLGTLVVEANIKSGTLITANLAAHMGKEVFAIPGNIHNPQTQGCHHLIQQGAKLVTSIEHIFEEFPHLTVAPEHLSDNRAKKSHAQSLATDKLLDSVDFDATAVDIIAERNQLPVSEVLAALLEYELRGLITAVPGGYVKLRGK